MDGIYVLDNDLVRDRIYLEWKHPKTDIGLKRQFWQFWQVPHHQEVCQWRVFPIYIAADPPARQGRVLRPEAYSAWGRWCLFARGTDFHHPRGVEVSTQSTDFLHPPPLTLLTGVSQQVAVEVERRKLIPGVKDIDCLVGCRELMLNIT